MIKVRLGTNFVIFVLFFGMAAIESIQTKNWLKAAFWLLISLVFLFADNIKKKK